MTRSISAMVLLAFASSLTSLTLALGQTGTPPATAPAEKSGKGIGPVKSVKIDPAKVDAGLASKGKTIFDTKCTACHKLDQKYVGPSLSGVTQRREPEWIMNMMLNPGEMIQKDPVAMELFATHLTPMPAQGLTEADARSILEYFRQNDAAAKTAQK